MVHRDLFERARIAGILTEDISEGKKYQIVDFVDENYSERIVQGVRERFFIDPLFPNDLQRADLGRKYLTDEARIDL